MLLWIVAAGAAAVAVMSLVVARGLRRRLDHLTQSYWELRYEYTRLRSQLARLDPASAAEPEPPEPPVSGYVPLSSLKK
jgi:hypothetical protein